jgi:uncharacterized protein (TIGR03085 family)
MLLIRAGMCAVTSDSGHASHSAQERAALADALAAAGSDAPTLCTGWTARDLAAHLVARERRPDSAPGILVPALSGWTERVRRDYARRPFEHLVDRFRSGPPALSWAALPGVDSATNLTEHFVHCEDVRRAAPGWAPRELPPERQEALWRVLRGRGRWFFRKSPVGVRLADLGGQEVTARDREPVVVVRGAPAELVLFAFGRKEHAEVALEGPEDAVARLRATELGV